MFAWLWAYHSPHPSLPVLCFPAMALWSRALDSWVKASVSNTAATNSNNKTKNESNNNNNIDCAMMVRLTVGSVASGTYWLGQLSAAGGVRGTVLFFE